MVRKIIKNVMYMIICLALVNSFCVKSFAVGNDNSTDDFSSGTLDTNDLFSFTESEELTPIEKILPPTEEGTFDLTIGPPSEPYEIDTYNEAPEAIAALPDLVMKNLTAIESQPFELVAGIPFSVQVENLGSTAANNVKLSVFMNGTKLGQADCGNIPAGTGVKLEFDVGTDRGGMHTLSLIVNESHAIVESNYSNNSITGSYRWASYNGICAFSFESTDGVYEFPIETPQEFTLQVANFGATDVSNVSVAYIVNTTIVQTFTMSGTIPPGYARSGTISVGFGLPGHRNLGILVDPGQVISDPDRSDNILTSDVIITSSSGLYVQNRIENYDKVMVSTDHGITVLSFTCGMNENYNLSGSTAQFSHRNGFVSVTSSRPSYDTPYNIVVGQINHENLAGTVLRRFTTTPYDVILPSGLFYAYHEENRDIVSYPKRNSNQSGFGVSITGSDAILATSFKHFVSLNVE